MNDSTQAWLAGIAVGFALCAVLVLAHTAGCLTRPGYVWHVDGRVCAPERAFVPAGYAPVEVRTK